MASSDHSRPPTAAKPDTPSPELSSATELSTPSPTNEFFDDVFGSGPPSPILPQVTDSPQEDASPQLHSQGVGRSALAPTLSTHSALSSETNGYTDGPSQAEGAGGRPTPVVTHRESSDVARLRSIHTTAGYREGLSAAKEAALQPGFDEGYSLGAAVGMKAGLIVGMIQALAEAVDWNGNEGQEAVDKLRALAQQCRIDLQRSSLLSDEYIDMEGLWTWQTPPNADIHQVAGSHPMVYKWQTRLDSICEALGVNSQKLEERWIEESESKEGLLSSSTSKAESRSTVKSTTSKGRMFDF